MTHAQITAAIAALNLPVSVTTKHQVKTFRADYMNEQGEPETTVAVVRWDDRCFKGGCCHEDVAHRLPRIAHLIRWHLFDPSGPMHYIANTVYLAGDRDCHGLRKGEFRQHTSRGRQAGGVEGVPCWELSSKPDTGQNCAGCVYAEEKPAPVTLEWVPYGRTGEGKERELDAARLTARWPDATDEELTAPGLEERLIARLPALIAAMKLDVEALGFTY